ncbi:hypothetical protein [Marinicella sp. W31]|uniref:hypothetical protein n=1 Tax=Marinicella sp. W31 TaxID=3023713 RepID=UPI00375655FB
MKYIELSVRTAMIVHGFNDDNWEVTEKVQEETYVKKMIAVDRIQSVSAEFLLVSGSHDRMMYWEYQEDYDEVRTRLQLAGLLI